MTEPRRDAAARDPQRYPYQCFKCRIRLETREDYRKHLTECPPLQGVHAGIRTGPAR